jgi:hypothetical protein
MMGDRNLSKQVIMGCCFGKEVVKSTFSLIVLLEKESKISRYKIGSRFKV